MAPIALESTPVPSHLLMKHAEVEHVNAPAVQPVEVNQYQGYDHVHWYVGNAKQAAAFYVTRMGFRRVAYRGLETGSKVVASHVVSNGSVMFVFTSPLYGLGMTKGLSKEDMSLLKEVHEHLTAHGDAVKDVAFAVDDVESLYDAAVSKGARVISAPRISQDGDGVVKMATIQTYGDTSESPSKSTNITDNSSTYPY